MFNHSVNFFVNRVRNGNKTFDASVLHTNEICKVTTDSTIVPQSFVKYPKVLPKQ